MLVDLIDEIGQVVAQLSDQIDHARAFELQMSETKQTLSRCIGIDDPTLGVKHQDGLLRGIQHGA